MKVTGLTGALLDYWVAKAEGFDQSRGHIVMECMFDTHTEVVNNRPAYSSNWAQGGPIIEREAISTESVLRTGDLWEATDRDGFNRQCGPTPLIAAMRAYVASKFGDTVPDEQAA